MFLLNALKTGDIIFFSVCAAIILIIVAIYFLIPVFKKKQLEEARASLRKRELNFKKESEEKDKKED